MDFNEPICAEIEGDADSEKFKKYLNNHGIEFTEEIDDYKFVGDLHIFHCRMTREELYKANSETDALFYQ